MSYVSSDKAVEHYKVSDQTLRRWAKNKQIEFKKTNGGHRRYLIPDEETENKIIYCRVSTKEQKEDLQRQKKYMQKKYPKYEVVSDIGSGIDHTRKNFVSLLQRVFKREISTIVVSSADRFTRCEFDFFEWLLLQFGCKLICLRRETDGSYEQELSQDLLSIVTNITAGHNKPKRTANKK